MARKILFLVTAAVCIAIGFAAGRWWGFEQVPALPRFQLSQPLTLQTGVGQIGSLPKGATLYEYRALGETDTFILFVNTNCLTLLSRSPETGSVIHPIDAYVKDTK